MRLWKLTDEKGQTYNDCQWGEGVKHTISRNKRSTELCTNGLIHAYENPNLALLLDPIHADFFTPMLWEAQGVVKARDWGKCGCWSLTTIKKLELPEWYRDKNQFRRVAIMFAILCAESVLYLFEKDNTGDDRPREAINAAKDYLSGINSHRDKSFYAYCASKAYSVSVTGGNAIISSVLSAVNCVYTVYSSHEPDVAITAIDAAQTAYCAAKAVESESTKINFSSLADRAVKKGLK